MKWFHRHKTLSTSRIAPETEAYLAGTYATFASKLGREIPPWAWLNRCAHGDLGALRSIPSPRLGDTWAKAEHVLAHELIALVDGDEQVLERIQHHILIPLELVLIDSEPGEELTAPGLVLSVRAALRSSLS